MALEPIVFIVDDDRGIRESLLDLMESFDLEAIAFGSATEFMAHPRTERPACLILDVHLPDMNGLDLQRAMERGDHPHIVFISGQGDIPSSVRAIKAGAVDFLTKPIAQDELMRAVRSALEQDRDARRRHAELRELRSRVATLTPRERDVLPLVAGGLLNKQAAAELGISENTVQIHRGQVMKKMRADSLAELVRMVGTLGLTINRPRSPGERAT